MPSSACARFLLSRKVLLLPLLQHLSSRQTAGTFRLQFQQLRYASKRTSKAAGAKKKVPPLDAVIKRASKAAGAKKKVPPLDAVIKTAPPAPPMAKYFSLSESLGSSGKKNIILYACNNRLFIVGCYGLATGMVAWSVYTFNTNIADKGRGVPQWAVTTSYVSVTVMMLMAGVVAYYPTRIIQVIHAHPIPGTVRTPPRVSITLHRRPILPTLPMRKIQVASPDLITLGEPLQSKHAAKPAPTPKLEDTGSTATKIRHGITGAPFKMFKVFRRALSAGEFVMLKVEGVGKFRISKDGWVWERRGLDRLFKVARRGF